MGATCSVGSERFPLIIDATLREGTQAPGVSFGVETSVEIARLLVALGVDTVECGHPAAGAGEEARVRAVVDACGSIPVLAHARATLEDVEAIARCGASWAGIFVGVNALSQSARVRPTQPMERLIQTAVSHACSLGLRVRFTVEDGSRTPWPSLLAAFDAAIEAGAARICLADTVGALTPWQVEEYVARIRNALPEVDLELHLHDDRGLAGANALAASRAGAEWISSSVNGIGERAGITDTLMLAANLAADGFRPAPDGDLLQRTSRVVQAHARLPVDRWRPLVGANVSTHVARLHRRAVRANPDAYSWTDFTQLGRQNSTQPATVPAGLSALANTPQVISATELRHHRSGPGVRYLMLDDRVVPDARQYCIVRTIPEMEDYGAGHVDLHRHVCDSFFLFLGSGEGLVGLTVEVQLADDTRRIESPTSIFIPAGAQHSYRVLGGSGLFINFVAAGCYNSSLLPEAEPQTKTEAEAMLEAFVKDRLGDNNVDSSTPLESVFDSLLFLDLFIQIEGRLGEAVSLDAVSTCKTFGDLAALLDAAAQE